MIRNVLLIISAVLTTLLSLLSNIRIIFDDRLVVHAEYINNNRNIIRLQSGDIVIVRTDIQSN